MRERLERLWPTLVAACGTVVIVVFFLWLFGGGVNDSTPGQDAAAAEQENSTSTNEPAPSTETSTSGEGDEHGSDDDSSESTQTPSTNSDDSDDSAEEFGETDNSGEPDDSEGQTAEPSEREPVGVANQTSISGLAEDAKERFEDGGWDVAATGNFRGSVPETTVYYPEGMEEAARALMRQFPEIARVKPSFDGLNQTRLVVILADDYPDKIQSSR